MFLFRWLSLILLLLALMLLGADLVSTLEKGGTFFVRSFDQILMLFHADAKPWLQQNLPAQLASAATVAISWPGWMVLGLPGAVLSALTVGRREPRVYRRPIPPPLSR